MPAAVAPPANWNAVLTDLAWIVEWAERFPNEDTHKALDWARKEMTRISSHLESLPPEHRLTMPNVEEYAIATEAVRNS